MCQIIEVGKRRDGGYRYWCLTHRADGTAKYGKAALRCVAADDLPITPEESRDLDISAFPGGVALWGAVPAAYDTTALPLDRGIHVHARKKPGGTKFIDDTYRRLNIPLQSVDLFSDGWVAVDEVDAINFMVSRVFGFDPIHVACSFCGFPHLDRDWFAVHNHRRHQCHGCGRQFSDSASGIGNPLCAIRNQLRIETRALVPATGSIDIRQSDYPGGIQLWGSNPAIIWTSALDEREGIHLHCFKSGNDEMPKPDDTYREISIDGVKLDPLQVRYYMAQNAMPHLDGRIVALTCPSCGTDHFDLGENAFTPHVEHQCVHCGTSFQAPTKIKKTIGNPFVAVRESLAAQAVAPVREDRLGLRPETI